MVLEYVCPGVRRRLFSLNCQIISRVHRHCWPRGALQCAMPNDDLCQPLLAIPPTRTAVKGQGRFRSASGRAHEKQGDQVTAAASPSTSGCSDSNDEPLLKLLKLLPSTTTPATPVATMTPVATAPRRLHDRHRHRLQLASAAAAAIPEPPPRRRRAEDHRRAKGENEGAALRHQILLLAQAGRTS